MSNWTQKLGKIPLRLVTETNENSQFFLKNPKLVPFKKEYNRNSGFSPKESASLNIRQRMKRNVKAKTRFDGINVNTDAQSTLVLSIHTKTPSFKLNSRP